MKELSGIDYYWYCMDGDGQIAVMLTAGLAPIPSSVLRNLTGNDDLRQRLLQLPKRGGYLVGIRDFFVKDSSGVYTLQFIGENPIADDAVARELYGDFFDHAAQGIYGYDWLDIHRIKKWESNRYELIARPANPLVASELSDHLQNILTATKLAHVRFGESNAIDVAAHLTCG